MIGEAPGGWCNSSAKQPVGRGETEERKEMGEEIQEWQYLWGAKVKMPIDVPDDILKDGVNTVRAKLEVCFVHCPMPRTPCDVRLPCIHASH